MRGSAGTSFFCLFIRKRTINLCTSVQTWENEGDTHFVYPAPFVTESLIYSIMGLFLLCRGLAQLSDVHFALMLVIRYTGERSCWWLFVCEKDSEWTNHPSRSSILLWKRASPRHNPRTGAARPLLITRRRPEGYPCLQSITGFVRRSQSYAKGRASIRADMARSHRRILYDER